MELFFILLILLVATRTFGEVAERLGQPGLVGELIAGITLGTVAAQYADLLPHIAGLDQNPVFDSITDLGMFFIMLFAGVELQPSRLIQHSREAFTVAICGMVLPVALGMALGAGLALLVLVALYVLHHLPINSDQYFSLHLKWTGDLGLLREVTDQLRQECLNIQNRSVVRHPNTGECHVVLVLHMRRKEHDNAVFDRLQADERFDEVGWS